MLLEPIKRKFYAELEKPTYTFAKAPGATLRHSQTKPHSSASRHGCRNHPFHCLTLPPAPPSATPKPHSSASRRGCRNHPFHCLTLLLEPIRRKFYAELERPTYTLAKAPGATLRHSQTPCQREPPAPPSATPKPHSTASRHGCRNHPFHCLTLLLEPIRRKLYAELEKPTYTLAKPPAPVSATPKPHASENPRRHPPPLPNPIAVRVDAAAETTLSTA